MSDHVKRKSKSSGRSRVGTISLRGEGLDEAGHRYVRLTVHAPEGKKKLVIPLADLEGSFGRLIDAGAKLHTREARDEFRQKLQSHSSGPPEFTVVTRLGWWKGAYILPDRVIGTLDKDVEVLLDGIAWQLRAKHRKRGDLKDWQAKVGRLCVGNSRLMFAVSLALAGPLLRFLDVEPGGFQFHGPPNTGKTTTGYVGGSVWGRRRDDLEKGFMENWANTPNALEPYAPAHHHGFLVLDETNLAGDNARGRWEIIRTGSWRLAMGEGKGRRHEKTDKGRLWILSTSNFTLDELAKAARLTVDDATRVRMVEIPLPSRGMGLFEELHGKEDAGALADALKQASLRFYGTPIRAYLKKLGGDRDKDKSAFRQRVRGYSRKYRLLASKKLGASPDGDRIRKKFGAGYAAARLGIRYGVLPWNEKALRKAILSCERDHRAFHDKSPPSKSASSQASYSKLQAYIADNLEAFRGPNTSPDGGGEPPGYRGRHGKNEEFWIPEQVVQRVMGGKAEASAAKLALEEHGWIATAKGGKEGRRFSVKREIGGKLTSVIAIKADILNQRPSA